MTIQAHLLRTIQCKNRIIGERALGSRVILSLRMLVVSSVRSALVGSLAIHQIRIHASGGFAVNQILY